MPDVKKEEEKIKSKRLPRPDWRHKIDLELYRKLERTYVEVALEVTKDLPAPWRIKTVEFMLSQASHKSRMIILDQEERRGLSRKWFAKRISNKTRELYNRKFHLAGEFAKVVTGRELKEMFPEKGSEILEMEETLAGLKCDLNRELNRILAVEADKDHEQLMITMNGGDTKRFYSSVKVNKVILNNTPKFIRHEGRIYTGKDVLKCCALAVAQQSGELVNIPGKLPTAEYVMKKESVLMKKLVARYDETYFNELNESDYKDVLSKLPTGKSPDIYGVMREHITNAPIFDANRPTSWIFSGGFERK